MIVVGITGAVASGKTTVANLFADAGIPVFSADAAVREIYRTDPEGIAGVAPGALVDGRLDRSRLAAMIEKDPDLLAEVERVVHPLVRGREEAFVAKARGDGQAIAVLEVPLLFESGADLRCDKILVTSAPAALRAKRVAERGTMSPALMRQLEARQIAEEERVGRADYVVDGASELDELARQVGHIIDALRGDADATVSMDAKNA